MIYLIDTIGKETGAHLYDASFLHKCNLEHKEVIVLSNFEASQTKAIFQNFYRGNKFEKVVKFVYSWLCLLCFYVRHFKNNTFIYQSFGLRIIDMLFCLILIHSNHFFIVAHDLFDIRVKDGIDKYRNIKIRFYNKYIHHIICHSSETVNGLKEFGYTGETYYFPHVSYDFDKTVDLKTVGADLVESIDKAKINILFFGQLRESKGIDILLDAMNYLKNDSAVNICNIIIAGQDKDNLVTRDKLPKFVKFVNRYITDNELNFLFTQCKYTVLPYKNICQSGVLEVAIYFQIPAIMSDIPYFKQFINKYPSFGRVYTPNTASSLSKQISELVTSSKDNLYYLEKDRKHYAEEHSLSGLLKFIE